MSASADDSRDPADKEPLTLYVKTLTGKTVQVDLRWGQRSRSEEIKWSVEDKEGVPWSQQRLIFAGRQMDDSANVGDMNIGKESTLHLVLRLRGGGTAADDGVKVVYEVEGATDGAPSDGTEHVIGVLGDEETLASFTDRCCRRIALTHAELGRVCLAKKVGEGEDQFEVLDENDLSNKYKLSTVYLRRAALVKAAGKR